MATPKKAAPKKAASAKPAANDWRADILARARALIHAADPNITVSNKWAKASNPAGVPTWERDGIICTGETYKDKVKFTFARGASLPDPSGLFNASLDAGTRRAIDILATDKLNEKAFKALIKAAADLNTAKKAKKK